MSEKAETTTPELPEIDGIEQLEKPTKGSKPGLTVYYRDQAEALAKAAMALPVREKYFIAPKTGWPKRIFRRASK